jgi:transposase-like protein
METSKQPKKFGSFVEMLTVLPDDNACRLFLEDLRWDSKPVCPHCGSISDKHYELKTKGVFTGLRKCRDCRERFTVTVGTMFEGSHVPLRKWFIAIYIFTTHKKGISSLQLGRDLGITQKSAWFVLSRIRQNFGMGEGSMLGGSGTIVEVDETVVGGKVKNMSNKKRKQSAEDTTMRHSNKTIVVGIVERGSNLRLQAVKKGDFIPDIVRANVDTESVLMTDTANTYVTVGKEFAHHETIDHTKKEYARGVYYTNTIEGAFSLFDRMVIGIYHSVSPKHIQKYADECAFRYNIRKTSDSEKFISALTRAEKRLTYKDLIAN